MKEVTLIFTPHQLQAFVSLMQTSEANLGCSDSDKEMAKDLKSLVRMLKKNGYKSPINL